MSNTKKVVLIVTAVALVCLIGAGIVVGVFFAQGKDFTSFFNIFDTSRVKLDESQTLDLSGVSALSVECASGSIAIKQGSEPGATLSGSLWAAEQKEKYLKVAKQGDTLEISLDIDTAFLNFIDVRIEVCLPQDCGLNLNVNSASGSINIAGLRLSDVAAHCASGTVSVSDCSGGALSIGTASGATRLNGTDFETSQITGQSGDINIQEASGAITVRNTSGRVEVMNKTKTAGELDIGDTSGDVTVELKQAEISPIRVSVTSGGIRLSLDAGAAFNLSASTTSGDVRCDFDITVNGNVSSHGAGEALSGKCNGGGPAVNLQTISGGISIIKK